MILRLLLLCICSPVSARFLFVEAAGTQQHVLDKTTSPLLRTSFYDHGLEVWLAQEQRIAIKKLLGNLSPLGHHVEGAAAGTIIASPSRGQGDQPDYYYQWTRDAAITSSTLVSLYLDDPASELSMSIANFLDSYTNLTQHIQHQTNPSGGFDDLSGLGEPKFHVDGSPFTEPWGRPQRDGPALRSIAQMKWLRAWNSTNSGMWAYRTQESQDWFDRLYSATLPANSTIKADLEYVSHVWREDGFDLWEEIRGRHFFTAMVQLRAMHEGAKLASFFDDFGAAKWYRAQEAQLRGFMYLFWDEKRGHLMETLAGSRSGLDCGILLGALHGSWDEDESTPYPPWSDEVLATLHALVKDQAVRHPINHDTGNWVHRWTAAITHAIEPSQGSHSRTSDDETKDDDFVLRGVGLGRYPEDVYDGSGARGGNPWFLCTSAAAETLFRTASHMSSRSSLYISDASLPFWRSLLAEGSPARQRLRSGHYTVNDRHRLGQNNRETFTMLRDRLFSLADEFLQVVRRHATRDGSLSEQFDSVTGFERGARDLTWSYGAFLDALRARKEASQHMTVREDTSAKVDREAKLVAFKSDM